MEKCYLFGAGSNSYGVIKFVGKENIIALIDNNEKKHGYDIEGIQIISFADFLEAYQGETVIISGYVLRKEIKEQLRRQGITNYVTAPFMQQGYFESFQEMITHYNLDKMESLYIYGQNFFSQGLYRALQMQKREGIVRSFIREEAFCGTEFEGKPVISIEEVPPGANILLAVDPDDAGHHRLSNGNTDYYIVDLYQQKIKKHEELQKFRNIHKGKRCFLIGNGPSLRIEDLNVLAENKEICFAANFITNAFDETVWRPDYYVVIDYLTLRILPYEKLRHITKFIPDMYFQGTAKKDEDTYIYQSYHWNDREVGFSEDIVNGIYTGLTVTYNMIQIAAYMGFKEIYLLGVDCSNGNKHFYRADAVDTSKLELRATLPDDRYALWIKAYQKAEEYSRDHDFQIFNATRGGELEVFKRVDFDGLFKDKK